jgi:LPXTG-motif cell wall-anchored protein
MKKHLIIILIIFILIPNKVFGATESNVLNLTVDPQKVLFDNRNLKPGDSFERKISVINNGEYNDFKYIATSKFLNGSKEFYDQLTLTIKDNSKVIFEGNLHQFEKLNPRLLKSNSKEDLYFFVSVPYELDNSYQGLECKFQLKFYVEGTLGGVLPADGPKLPNTGSDMFNILVAGAVLVLTGSTFHFFVKKRSKLRKEL